MYSYFTGLFNDLPFMQDDVLPVFCFIFAFLIIDRIMWLIADIFRRK